MPILKNNLTRSANLQHHGGGIAMIQADNGLFLQSGKKRCFVFLRLKIEYRSIMITMMKIKGLEKFK